MPTKQQQQQRRHEKFIRGENEKLLQQRRALVTKCHEAPVVPGTHIPRERSDPDFTGFTVDRPGRPVAFEAKATLSKTVWDIKIEDHQASYLRWCQHAGGISFVHILSGAVQIYVTPFHVVDHYLLNEWSSIPFDELEQYQRAHGETWLDTWARIHGEDL